MEGNRHSRCTGAVGAAGVGAVKTSLFLHQGRADGSFTPQPKPGGVNEGFGFEWSRSVNRSPVLAGCSPAGCADGSRAGFAAGAALEAQIHRRNGMKMPRDLQGSGKIRARALKCLNHRWGGDRSDDRQVKAACGRLRRGRPRRQI